MKAKQEIPVPVQTLNDVDLGIIQTISFQMEYPVDIPLMQINVPQHQIEEALNNQLVKTLRSVYNFSLQSTIV